MKGGIVVLGNRIAAKYILYSFCLVNVVLGVIFNFTSAELYAGFVTEDGYVEYMTAFVLLGLSIYALRKGLYLNDKPATLLYLLIGLGLFFGFGEEISWGQRFFGFDTPEELKTINDQSEFNLHNLKFDGISINRLIFGSVMYSAVIVYFLVFPYLYKYSLNFKKLIKKFHIPIPTWTQTALYLFSFAILHTLAFRSWELQELTFISFICLVFIDPKNPDDL